MVDKLKESRAARALAVASTAVMLTLMGGSVAYAQTSPPFDPLDGAGDAIFTDLQSFFVGKLIPGVIALTVVGIGLTMLVRYSRKASKA